MLFTFILKCAMLTFTLIYFFICFDPKMYIYLCCNSLPSLATHAVSGTNIIVKNKLIACCLPFSVIITCYKVKKCHVQGTDLCSTK